MGAAMLIDVENLLGGYSRGHIESRDFPFTAFIDAIHKNSGVERFDIKRCYADWTHYKYGMLRSDMLDFGVEPIQVFQNKAGADAKNVSDIAIAADAIELCLRHDHIHTFLLVTGDGGFASVARKLRSYGKQVIGCGVKGSVSRMLRSACDSYIDLVIESSPAEAPTQANNGQQGGDKTRASAAKPLRHSDPLVNEVLNLTHSVATDDQLTLGREVAKAIDRILTGRKITFANINVFSQAARQKLPQFDHVTCGYRRLLELAAVCFDGLSCGVFENTSVGSSAIAPRSQPPDGHRLVPAPPTKTLQTPEGYMTLFRKLDPPLPSISPVAINATIDALKLIPGAFTQGDLFGMVATRVEADLEDSSIKFALRTLIGLGVLKAEGKAANEFEQKWRVAANAAPIARPELERIFAERLSRRLVEVDRDVIAHAMAEADEEA